MNPQGPADGKLQRSDVLIAITDDHPRIPKDGTIISRGYVYVMEVLRGVEHRRPELQSEIRHLYGQLPSMLAVLAASIGFCLVGVVLGVARPEDYLTRRASLTLLVFASYEIYVSLLSMSSLLASRKCIIYYLTLLGNPLQFALAYSFYYRFPQSVPHGRFLDRA